MSKINVESKVELNIGMRKILILEAELRQNFIQMIKNQKKIRVSSYLN
jgi:hypothetical protein